MRIAVASGKGGTGKTTVALALANVLGNSVLIDCDVEAPNAHIFLDPKIEGSRDFHVMVPVIDHDKCTGCGECARVCQYNALAVVRKTVIQFPELCHSSGGCVLICEPKAIAEGEHLIGEIQWGKAGRIDFYNGRLKIGEHLSPPLIKELKKMTHDISDRDMILDCPPGTTCPMIEAVRNTDYCVLVTEPTPFGLHDLEMAAEVVSELGIPSGVIINRADMGDDSVRKFCIEKGLTILLEIPHKRKIAEGYAIGENILQVMPELRELFQDVLRAITEEIAV